MKPVHFVAALSVCTFVLAFDPVSAGETTGGKAVAGSANSASPKAPVDRRKEIAARRKAMAKVKLVDVNNATAEQLKKLPGIGDAEAAKIIAGRPYLSKAHLVTHNVLSPEAYEKLKSLVIVGQNQATAAKLGELQKVRKKP